MASCSIEYSPEVAERAARQFFWRKWRTPFGILLLSSFVILSVVLIVWVYKVGADWFVGMLGTILAANLIIQWSLYSRFPKALARSAADLKSVELETSDEGIRLSSARSANFIPWSKFSAIWIYDEFLLLRWGKSPTGSRFIHIPAQGMTPEVRAAFEGVRARLAN